MNRPFELDPLFRPITDLPGIGPKNAKLLERLCGGGRIVDLLWHLPVDFIDRRHSPPVKDVENSHVVTLQIRVLKHFPNARKGQPYRVNATDSSAEITLTFFHGNRPWIEKQLPIGEERVVSGKVDFYQGKPQIVHPDIVMPEERETLAVIEPIYPLTAGITNKVLHKAVTGALKFLPDLPEWMNMEFKKRQHFPGWIEAMRSVHAPESLEDLMPDSLPRQRLAYDEFFANQLTLELVRRKQRRSGRSFSPSGNLRERLLAALPFELTNAQRKAMEEIDGDMTAPEQMLRLLQGDVGSGKTVVAALTALNAIENGAQAAIMAPTEILARQHAETLAPWMEACGVRMVILTGRDKGKARTLLLDQIADGKAQLVIGTHAIFQNDVVYADLGVAIIDEQHRFGVQQRLTLSQKNKRTDVLVMTATPIPRTLALTAYGDMDISKLDEKPPGRKPVETLLIPLEKIEDMIEGIKRKLEQGVRVYWVCPLVEESEFSDMAAAEERYDVLKALIGESVGLVHGRMEASEKDRVMSEFASGALNVLVATTVIEVGVNVPEATVIVIEHAERFGLSQLHQLRGRVGRGAQQSYCFLLYASPLGVTAKERLSVMRQTEDGFLIAEKDLRLRGSGDILGLKQSGAAEFRLADLGSHGGLLAAARDDARLFLSGTDYMLSQRWDAIKFLLYLFGKDQAYQYLRSG